uniref:PPM-type phosphatase domain-containing protein n=1 Tax=Toxocara canis TaxID=6265 RepID=A0A183VGE1_TOXCA
LLCCHSGISQWMTSRDNIRQIPRPTYRKHMKMLDRCLLTDILWAIPTRFQRVAFTPSPEVDAGFAFNEAALDSVMRALHVTTIVRSHQHRSGGFHEDFRAKCYTVYTVPFGIEDRCYGAVLHVQRSADGGMEITPIQHREQTANDFDVLCERTIEALRGAFESIYEPPIPQQKCQLCEAKTCASLRSAFRLATHYDIGYWMRKNAKNYIENNEDYRRIPTKFKELRATELTRLFPLYYDIKFLQAGTYRVVLSADEWNTIREAHPEAVLNTSPVSIASSWHDLDFVEGVEQQDENAMGVMDERVERNEESDEDSGEDEVLSIGESDDPLDANGLQGGSSSTAEPIASSSVSARTSSLVTYPIDYQSVRGSSSSKRAHIRLHRLFSRPKDRMVTIIFYSLDSIFSSFKRLLVWF